MKNLKRIIIAVILILLIVGYYYYLSHRVKSEDGKVVEETRLSEVLVRDLDKNYPPSPKEVVKFYSDIMQCYYGEDYTDDELNQIADKARQLFDSELLESNGKEQYLENLKDDIAEYKAAKRKIFAVYVCSSDEVEYYTYQNANWAKVKVVYSLREGTKFFKTHEEFVLRQDENGNYKIFGWYLIDGDAENESTE